MDKANAARYSGRTNPEHETGFTVGYVGLVFSSSGPSAEFGDASWKITRPGQRWGVQVGAVWGSYRAPFARPGKSTWFDKPLLVLRWSGRLFSRWVPLPWFHAWHWTVPQKEWAIGSEMWRAAHWHPARLYVGGKRFFVGLDAATDPAGHAWARQSERGNWYTVFSMSFRVGGRGK